MKYIYFVILLCFSLGLNAQLSYFPTQVGTVMSLDFQNLESISSAIAIHDAAHPDGSGYEVTNTGASAINFTGIAGGVHGEVLLIRNITPDFNVRLQHDDGNSTLGNRFILPSANQWTMNFVSSVYIIYDENLDGGNGAWHVLNTD